MRWLCVEERGEPVTCDRLRDEATACVAPLGGGRLMELVECGPACPKVCEE